MAEIIRVGDELTVHMSRWERIGSLHVDVRVPCSSVVDVRVVPDGLVARRGVKLVGSGIPGVLILGTTCHGGGKDFCVVRGHGPAIEIDLDGEVFARLLVSDASAKPTLAGLGLGPSAG